MARLTQRWVVPLADMGLLLTAGLATQLALIEDSSPPLHHVDVSPVELGQGGEDPSPSDAVTVAINPAGVVRVGAVDIGRIDDPAIASAAAAALPESVEVDVLLIPDESRTLADVGVLWPAFAGREVSIGATVVDRGGAP